MRVVPILLLAVVLAGPVRAGEPPADAPPANAPPAVSTSPPSGTSDNAGATPLPAAVFRAFHGKAGIERIVADLNAQFQTDPRIRDIFRATDLTRLQIELVDQLCYLTGGPCTYTGKDMKTAHKDLGLQDADLNALVEDLQNAMDREGVSFHAQNRLLAKLAPMRRQVVVR